MLLQPIISVVVVIIVFVTIKKRCDKRACDLARHWSTGENKKMMKIMITKKVQEKLINLNLVSIKTKMTKCENNDHGNIIEVTKLKNHSLLCYFMFFTLGGGSWLLNENLSTQYSSCKKKAAVTVDPK